MCCNKSIAKDRLWAAAHVINGGGSDDYDLYDEACAENPLPAEEEAAIKSEISYADETGGDWSEDEDLQKSIVPRLFELFN